MKLSWLIGQMISILYATLTMTYQSKYPVHPYVLVNRSVLCNCGIEAENHFLLKSLAACQDTNSKLLCISQSIQLLLIIWINFLI